MNESVVDGLNNLDKRVRFLEKALIFLGVSLLITTIAVGIVVNNPAIIKLLNL